MKKVLLACACLTLFACQGGNRGTATVKIAHLPPAPKDIIDAAMASSQLPLSDASCKGFGTESTDKTVGRYLAGYLAELSSQDARNALTTSVDQAAEAGEPVYVCRLMIRHAQGEDVWSWGLQFAVRKSDGVVLPGSVRCIGAG